MDNIYVRFLPLPHRVNGITVMDENADYNVYLNARLDGYRSRKAYLHELEHIRSGHFWRSLSAWSAEIGVELQSLV